MADDLQLRLITPRQAVVDQRVLEVTAPGTLGEFGVLPEHAAFLSSLEIGRLSFRDARGVKTYAVREGFAEVANDIMTVLTEAALPAADIDTARARTDLAAAEAELARLSPIDPAYAAAEAERRWAQTRLDVAGKPA
jgi:F-type H+-transporting ATPase subunit epsilon